MRSIAGFLAFLLSIGVSPGAHAFVMTDSVQAPAPLEGPVVTPEHDNPNLRVGPRGTPWVALAHRILPRVRAATTAQIFLCAEQTMRSGTALGMELPGALGLRWEVS